MRFRLPGNLTEHFSDRTNYDKDSGSNRIVSNYLRLGAMSTTGFAYAFYN
ncbi:hypothetical protein IQ277_03630 [Nostocales cyanobacterium LEGE 12452]|nr:hypothetical protein [Nostocales cyanobacterium LEGE 12452]